MQFTVVYLFRFYFPGESKCNQLCKINTISWYCTIYILIIIRTIQQHNVPFMNTSYVFTVVHCVFRMWGVNYRTVTCFKVTGLFLIRSYLLILFNCCVFITTCHHHVITYSYWYTTLLLYTTLVLALVCTSGLLVKIDVSW